MRIFNNNGFKLAKKSLLYMIVYEDAQQSKVMMRQSA